MTALGTSVAVCISLVWSQRLYGDFHDGMTHVGRKTWAPDQLGAVPSVGAETSSLFEVPEDQRIIDERQENDDPFVFLAVQCEFSDYHVWSWMSTCPDHAHLEASTLCKNMSRRAAGRPSAAAS